MERATLELSAVAELAEKCAPKTILKRQTNKGRNYRRTGSDIATQEGPHETAERVLPSSPCDPNRRIQMCIAYSIHYGRN